MANAIDVKVNFDIAERANSIGQGAKQIEHIGNVSIIAQKANAREF
jgi:hypothetical protein